MDSDHSSGIDLHIHSTASDGTCSPEEIVRMAVRLNLAAISITDHDTVEGSRAAMEAGIPDRLQFISGVEISTASPESYPCQGSMHILGYGIRVDDPELNQMLQTLQIARRDRNPKILRRLQSLGIRITMEELLAQANGGQAGRPHIARLMVKKGVVGSMDEAFDRYLGKGKPAYVDKYRVDCQQAIETIHNAGGISVLAHPLLLKPRVKKPLDELLTILTSYGLKGIEVFYPEHGQSHVRLFTEMAQRFGLLVTGGTDFHGDIKPGIQMGSGKGEMKIPMELFIKLRENI